MEALSLNEREALTRYVDKLIEDVGRLAALLEGRGVDAVQPRSAQASLVRTLAALKPSKRLEIRLDTWVSAAGD